MLSRMRLLKKDCTLIGSIGVGADGNVSTQIYFGGSDDYPNIPSRFFPISVTASPGTVDGSLRWLAARAALHMAIYPIRNAHGGPRRSVSETARRLPC